MRLITIAAAVAASALLIPGVTSRSHVTGVAYFRQVTTMISQNGAFPGSTQAWSTRVLLLHANKAVGTGGVACIYVTDARRECFGTYVLPQGRIKVIGEISSRSNYTLAIIGGTGVYASATGVAAFTAGLATFYLN